MLHCFIWYLSFSNLKLKSMIDVVKCYVYAALQRKIKIIWH